MAHWYARYPGDFAKKTAHLSMSEVGAYDLLMDWYYSNEKPLPVEWVQMHRICRAVAPEEQASVQAVVQQFFTLGEDGWHLARADTEIKKRNEISEKRRQAQKIREEKRLLALAKQGANKGANAPALAHTTTTTTIIKVDSKLSTLTSAQGVEAEMDFQRVWDAYPGYGGDGQVGYAFKGGKQEARKSFLKLYTNTKDIDRAEFINRLIQGAGKYKAFLEQSGQRGKHCVTWLNQHGWEDDYTISRQTGNQLSQGTGRSQRPGYSDSVIDAAGQALEHIRNREST